MSTHKQKSEEQVTNVGSLNQILLITDKRKNKTIRIQQSFELCPTMTEQHTAHESDINYLMEKYKPDELAAYLVARNAHRQQILEHDFSVEPNLQEAKNEVYFLKQQFENLPDDIKRNFPNAIEFYKFIDNPSNQEKMIKLGLFTKKEVEKLTTDITETSNNTSTTTTQTKDKEEAKQ